MEVTSIFIGNRYVRVAVGKAGEKRVEVQRLHTLMLDEGCLINGVITNEETLRAQLGAFWKAENLPTQNVALVIDSTQFLSKTVRVPILNEKQTLEVVKKELAPIETRQDPLVDYMLMSTDKATKTNLILASSVERGFIKAYASLFDALGVRLKCIDTAMASIIKLVNFLPLFKNKTCILLVFDGDNLHAVLVENGEYKYASRSRIFAAHGSADFGSEVTRTASGVLQFEASEKTGYQAKEVYFAKCDEIDFEACVPGCQTLNLSAEYIPDSNIVTLPANDKLYENVYVVGNLIRSSL